MQYAIRTFLIETSNGQEFKIAFKGCFYFKTASSRGRFVFPWNVNWTKQLSQSDFPVTFWSLKGKKNVSSATSVINASVFLKDDNFEKITNESPIQLDDSSIQIEINQLADSVKVPSISMDESFIEKIIEKSKISIESPNLTHLTSFTIPENIYNKL